MFCYAVSVHDGDNFFFLHMNLLYLKNTMKGVIYVVEFAICVAQQH